MEKKQEKLLEVKKKQGDGCRLEIIITVPWYVTVGLIALIAWLCMR